MSINRQLILTGNGTSGVCLHLLFRDDFTLWIADLHPDGFLGPLIVVASELRATDPEAVIDLVVGAIDGSVGNGINLQWAPCQRFNFLSDPEAAKAAEGSATIRCFGADQPLVQSLLGGDWRCAKSIGVCAIGEATGYDTRLLIVIIELPAEELQIGAGDGAAGDCICDVDEGAGFGLFFGDGEVCEPEDHACGVAILQLCLYPPRTGLWQRGFDGSGVVEVTGSGSQIDGPFNGLAGQILFRVGFKQSPADIRQLCLAEIRLPGI